MAIKSFYVPDNKRWLLRAITDVKRTASEKGIKLSDGQIILTALESYLASLKRPGDDEAEYEAVRPERSDLLRRTIHVAKEYHWLVEIIDRIIATKRTLGVSTSFSYELLRLAKNGYTRGVAGAEFDKLSLKDSLHVPTT